MTSVEKDGQKVPTENSGSVERQEIDAFLKTQTPLDKAVSERTAKRAAKSAQRAESGTQLKEKGNELFRKRDFEGAVRFYEEAIKVNGEKPVYLSNLAATLINLECFEEAEEKAGDALYQDPQHVKARYRRGIARKEQNLFKAAITDFETVLVADPENTVAQSELDIVRELWESGEGDETGGDTSDDEAPHLDDPKWDIPSVSDSSDCNHVGNGIPCRFYNHDGCGKGMACTFSHAPDDKSVRDNLGRNVCLFFLLGRCKFGDVKCIYSHSKKYLPEDAWWSEENSVKAAQELFEAVEGSKREQRALDDLLWRLQHGMSLDGDSGRRRSAGGRQKSGGKGKGKQTDAESSSGRKKSTKASRAPVPKNTATASESGFTDYHPNTRVTHSVKSRDDDDMPSALILCLEEESYFADMHAHVLAAVHAKFRISIANTPREALAHLASPGLAAVFVTDAGIVRRKHKKILTQLVTFARAGGRVVIGALFSGNVCEPDMDAFWRDGWGLPWKMGDYHRTTFSLRTDTLGDGLSRSYSMKAVHLKDITSDVAVYLPAEGARLQSMVFGPVPITDCDEAPVVYTRVGSGYVGYIGDVNAEEQSTAVVLAMMGASV